MILKHRAICLFTFVYCHRCLAIFADRRALEEHQATEHFADRLAAKHIECPHANCAVRFSKRVQLQRHQRHVHSAKRFPCAVCGKGFAERRKLLRHMAVHTGRRAEVCAICKRAFSDPSTLRQHITAVHGSAPRPFSCKKCGKRFLKQSVLRSHWRTHSMAVTERRQYECGVCGGVFTTKSNLKKHVKAFHENG